MSRPVRRTEDLRTGRTSIPGARYFVTACVARRDQVLATSETAWRIVESWREIHNSRDATILAATVMPDHWHALVVLGDRLTPGQVVGKIRSAGTRGSVQAGWTWQAGFFDRRLRADDAPDDFGVYLFMNPYRAGLVRLTDPWPWWFCPDPAKFRFMDRLSRSGGPQPEWLKESGDIALRLGECE